MNPLTAPVAPEDFNPKSMAVAQMWVRGTPDTRKTIETMHAHYRDQFQPNADTTVNPEGVAATLHMKVDKGMRRLSQTPQWAGVSCKKGCSACCHLPVRITREEAILIRWHMRKHGMTVDEGRLERQSTVDADSPKAWANLPPGDRKCVFLKQGQCSIYERRPMACRKYVVKNDPEFCDTEKHLGHEVAVLVDPEAEVIYSAALSVFDSDLMGAALLKVKP